METFLNTRSAAKKELVRLIEAIDGERPLQELLMIRGRLEAKLDELVSNAPSALDDFDARIQERTDELSTLSQKVEDIRARLDTIIK